MKIIVSQTYVRIYGVLTVQNPLAWFGCCKQNLVQQVPILPSDTHGALAAKHYVRVKKKLIIKICIKFYVDQIKLSKHK